MEGGKKKQGERERGEKPSRFFLHALYFQVAHPNINGRIIIRAKLFSKKRKLALRDSTETAGRHFYNGLFSALHSWL